MFAFRKQVHHFHAIYLLDIDPGKLSQWKTFPGQFHGTVREKNPLHRHDHPFVQASRLVHGKYMTWFHFPRSHLLKGGREAGLDMCIRM